MERLMAMVPGHLREIVGLLLAPIGFVPHAVRADGLRSQVRLAVVGRGQKYVFLLFPMVLGTIAIWCTQLSSTRVPFRTDRGRSSPSCFSRGGTRPSQILWLYWVDLVRAAMVSAGWLLALGHLAVGLGVALVRRGRRALREDAGLRDAGLPLGRLRRPAPVVRARSGGLHVHADADHRRRARHDIVGSDDASRGWRSRSSTCCSSS